MPLPGILTTIKEYQGVSQLDISRNSFQTINSQG